MKHKIFSILTLLISLTAYSQVDVPDSPEFESASVIPGANPAQVELKWAASDSLDVAGYYIFKVNSEGITNYLDTVYGRTTTTYFNNGSFANGQTETYRLAAFDTLDNISLLTNPHITMYAFPYYDKCALEVNLDWNAYDGWDNVTAYNIYRRKSGESYEYLNSVPGGETNFIDDVLEPNQQYCYYVEAMRANDVKATSNETCVFTSSHTPPAFIYADYASVENNQIELRFSVDTAGETIKYKVQRALDTPADFSTIKTISDTESIKLFYTDPDVKPEQTKYYYRLLSVDPCENISAVSNYASNIILSGYTDDQLNHYLEWDTYETWNGEIASYQIVSLYGKDSEHGIISLDNERHSYSVNISDYVKEKHIRMEIVPYTYCYFILAKEDIATNPFGVQGISKSNEICVSHKPRVYLPNAFFPNSYNLENRLFRPSISFAMPSNYEFAVYNRWGMEIFKTNDQTEGWNGTTGNSKAPPGRYVYFLSYTDFHGETFQKSGIFLLYNE
ncbi:MAG: gliding motility-associated C-terminal domain-containing protein [Bacteroidota bacterium]|nr:gliding motility-associated C-terminal domain-containing protein [Bacteroidota bacterium]